jgi:hypothetical protein
VWRTEEGDAVLKGAQWELFCEGLGHLWDRVEDEFYDGPIFESGIDAFDSLQPGQKLALLALVGKALKDESVPPPDRKIFPKMS